MSTKETNIRTYEITTTTGLMRMDIPEDWKVTYGPISPGSKYGSGGNALRVYESETKQRAIFADVLSFRDLSIPTSRLMIKTEGSEEWSVDTNGKRSSSSTKIERKWVMEDNNA